MRRIKDSPITRDLNVLNLGLDYAQHFQGAFSFQGSHQEWSGSIALSIPPRELLPLLQDKMNAIFHSRGKMSIIPIELFPFMSLSTRINKS